MIGDPSTRIVVFRGFQHSDTYDLRPRAHIQVSERLSGDQHPRLQGRTALSGNYLELLLFLPLLLRISIYRPMYLHPTSDTGTTGEIRVSRLLEKKRLSEVCDT